MLEERIDDIEEVPRELRVRPGAAGQLVAQAILGKLRKEARGAIQHDIDASRQLLGRQVLDRAEIDADQIALSP